MKQLITYLTFSGNCQKAMEFYKDCLGGDLYLQTMKDSPFGDELPEKIQECIIHAELKTESFILMATDLVGKHGLIRGNSVSIMLECSSKDELEDAFNKLSEKGDTTYPIEETFFGAFYGGLTDKFGNNWLLKTKKHL